MADENKSSFDFKGPAVVVVYSTDEDMPDLHMHGENMAEKVVGPFFNGRIANTWASTVAKLGSYEVVPLERGPSPVPGADYYGGPVRHIIRDPNNND